LTDQSFVFPKFYVTTPSPCPYLSDRFERKVFTELAGGAPMALHENLSQAGFRRSQSVAYRPACEGCTACVSVRIRVKDFQWSRSLRRIRNRNKDLECADASAWVTAEQFDLLKRYLDSRHGEGGMADMTIYDYAEMVETSPVETSLIEYRQRTDDDSDDSTGPLMATALTDVMSDGLSMVYSFFASWEEKRSLGTYLILDHVRRAEAMGKDYVYLGYWVAESPKMAYKARFQPLEGLTAEGWQEFNPPE
jgi:arginine-tRNA-protein transferase